MKTEISSGRFLVTGGTGTFGQAIVRRLLGAGAAEVVVFSRDEKKQYDLRNAIPDVRLEFALGDVRDARRVDEVVARMKPKTIFHAAAMKHVVASEANPHEAVLTNVIGAANVVASARRAGIERLIAISTDKAVEPINVMGMTKAIQERLVLDAGYTCVRYGNVVGSRGSVVPFFHRLFQEQGEGAEIPITHVDMTRFLLSVEDAIDLALYAHKNTMGGEVYVRKAPAARIVHIVQALAELCGIANYGHKVIGLVHGEKIHETLIAHGESFRATEADNYYVIRPRGAPNTLGGWSYRSCDALLSVAGIKDVLDRAYFCKASCAAGYFTTGVLQ